MAQARVMRKEEFLNLKIRRQIYQFILKYPGFHFSEISRKLNVPKTTLNYHLSYLEKHGFIGVKSEDRCTRFYVTENFGDLEKKLIHILRQETPRNIVLYIGWRLSASQAELSRELELAPKTIEKHLKKLLELGIIEPAPVENGVMYAAYKNKCIIERIPVGQEIVYRLARTSNLNVTIGALMDDLFTRYGKGLVNDDNTKLILDGFRLWCPNKTPPKRIRTSKALMEQLEERIYEIFPHPYHV